jgi:tetratricopeptide (TPR) repeat protein
VGLQPARLERAAHAPQSQTAQVRADARSAYLRACAIARAERLDALAVDALHMLAFVVTEPADQLRWGREALGLALASPQPAARKWEASLRNNIGHALRQLGRHDEALAEFRKAVALRERGGDGRSVRIAHWQVARTLRAMAHFGEAIEIQLRLERENDAAGTPDPYVFEELEALYGAQGDGARAEAYARRRQAARP